MNSIHQCSTKIDQSIILKNNSMMSESLQLKLTIYLQVNIFSVIP
jgi:hypothetical protein